MQESRQIIYDKYNGHCAYCGCKLKEDNWQIDHLIPIYRNHTDEELLINKIRRGTDTKDNKVPSCKQCNFYKSTFSIEDFRNNVQTIQERLLTNSNSFIYRLAVKFGIVKICKWNGKFYFERKEKCKQSQKKT